MGGDNVGLTTQGDQTSTASKSDPIEAVVAVAAAAIGMTPDAVRPAVAAAFARADEEGLDVHTANERLNPQ